MKNGDRVIGKYLGYNFSGIIYDSRKLVYDQTKTRHYVKLDYAITAFGQVFDKVLVDEANLTTVNSTTNEPS